MSATPSPAAAPDSASGSAGDAEFLKRKLELVQQDKQRLGETNAKLNERLRELEERLNATEQQLKGTKNSALEQSGEYRQLWEDAKATIMEKEKELAAVQRDLESLRETAQTERLRSNAMRDIAAAQALRPDQLLSLIAPNLREVDGKPVVLHGGMEVPLADHLARLRSPESGWDHHFAPSGARGMGARPSAGVPAPSGPNPFVTRNLTEQARLYRENRAEYDRLRAEAKG